MRGTLRPVKGRERYWEITVDAGRDPITGKRVRVVRGIQGGKRDAERALHQLVTNVEAVHWLGVLGPAGADGGALERSVTSSLLARLPP